MLNLKSFYFNPFGSCCTVAWDESKQAVIVDPSCYEEVEREKLAAFIEENALKPIYILLTHAHFDHIFAVSHFADKYKIPVVMNEKDREIIENNKYFCWEYGLSVPDTTFAEGQKIDGHFLPRAGEDTEAVRDAVEPTEPFKLDAENYVPMVLTIEDGDVVTWGLDRRWEVLFTPGHTPGGVSFLDREAGVLIGGDTLFAGSIGRTDNKWGDYDALIRSIFEKLMPLDGDITVIPGHGPYTTIGDERVNNPFLQPFDEINI